MTKQIAELQAAVNSFTPRPMPENFEPYCTIEKTNGHECMCLQTSTEIGAIEVYAAADTTEARERLWLRKEQIRLCAAMAKIAGVGLSEMENEDEETE